MRGQHRKPSANYPIPAMTTFSRMSRGTTPSDALWLLWAGDRPPDLPGRVDRAPSVSFFRERILTVRHRKVVWSAQGEPAIDRLLPRTRLLARLLCCPCGSRGPGRMLVVDEFNSPGAARRARSPHPDQPVRRPTVRAGTG